MAKSQTPWCGATGDRQGRAGLMQGRGFEDILTEQGKIEGKMTQFTLQSQCRGGQAVFEFIHVILSWTPGLPSGPIGKWLGPHCSREATLAWAAHAPWTPGWRQTDLHSETSLSDLETKVRPLQALSHSMRKCSAWRKCQSLWKINCTCKVWCQGSKGKSHTRDILSEKQVLNSFLLSGQVGHIYTAGTSRNYNPVFLGGCKYCLNEWLIHDSVDADKFVHLDCLYKRQVF